MSPGWRLDVFALWMVVQDPADAGTKSSLAIIKLYFYDIRVKEKKIWIFGWIPNLGDYIILGYIVFVFMSFWVIVIILF